MSEAEYERLRKDMLLVIAQHAASSGEVTGRSIIGNSVNLAMGEVPRHEFVPSQLVDVAYMDQPLPIGHDKTISQPFIVALMVDLLDLQYDEKVLEVGTGLGYQAAVLSRIATSVYTVDIIGELAEGAIENFQKLRYSNIEVRIGNGYYGWSEQAPFDKIIVATSSDSIPDALIEQLKPGGRLVMPVGPEESQTLVLYVKPESGSTEPAPKEILPVRFSRMVVAH